MDIKELLALYNKRTQEHFKQIETPNKSNNIKPPHFIEDVLMPIFQALSEHLPKRKIQMPENGYEVRKGYYRIQMGEKLPGGLSFVDDNTSKLFYTKLYNKVPAGDPIEVTSTEQIAQLIESRFVEPIKKAVS